MRPDDEPARAEIPARAEHQRVPVVLRVRYAAHSAEGFDRIVGR
jgi:hypothetical protein